MWSVSLNLVLWLAIAGLALLLELGHPGLFVFLSVMIGALAAAGTTLLDWEFGWQLLSFVLGLIAGAGVGYYWLRRQRHRFNRAQWQTNVYALVGKTGVVLSQVSLAQPGYVRLESESWYAKTVEVQPLQAGETVQVVGVKGCHVIVKRSALRYTSLSFGTQDDREI
ncbi:MAG TPA: NfeD family protein [Candidatus Babeliales bacterium]|nr:NfeD family protein [Candidatus Babeliales bacterium]